MEEATAVASEAATSAAASATVMAGAALEVATRPVCRRARGGRRISPDRHTFSRFGHGRSTAVFPYLYSPYGSYGFYDPGYPYYAPCDQYSPYYNPEYC